jgi:DNA-binding MarR family transcriptional regulator
MSRPEADAEPHPSAPLLYDLFVELVGRWTTETIEQQVIAAAAADVDSTEFQVLEILARTGALLSGELAEPLRMSPSNVSKVLARMEGKHLVTRTTSGADRRAVCVALTPEGEGAAEALRRAGETMIGELLSGWSPEDAAHLTGLLGRLLREVRARQFPDGAPAPWNREQPPSTSRGGQAARFADIVATTVNWTGDEESGKR